MKSERPQRTSAKKEDKYILKTRLKIIYQVGNKTQHWVVITKTDSSLEFNPYISLLLWLTQQMS